MKNLGNLQCFNKDCIKLLDLISKHDNNNKSVTRIFKFKIKKKIYIFT